MLSVPNSSRTSPSSPGCYMRSRGPRVVRPSLMAGRPGRTISFSLYEFDGLPAIISDGHSIGFTLAYFSRES